MCSSPELLTTREMPNTKTRILLIDDDASLRQMYSLIFAKAGYDLTTADDGVDGLAKIREGGWDLILLDLMMPNLNGIGVLTSLHDEGSKKENGKIVILSNAGYNEIAKEAIGLGAAGFLMKADLMPKDLLQAIQEYLPQR